MTPQERFWAKVNRTETCWLWTAGTLHNGYGKFYAEGRYLRAHRYAYELAHGPIPTGRQIDHTCHNRLCVRVGHLQAVTPSENSQNLSGAHRDSATGVRGVYWSTRSRRYIGEVMHEGRRYRAGAHRTLDAAAQAVQDLRNQLMTNNLLDRAG